MVKTEDRNNQCGIVIQFYVLVILVVFLYVITLTRFVRHRRNHRGEYVQ